MLDSASDQLSKFRTKIGLKQMLNQEEHTLIIDKLNLKYQC